MVEVTRAITIQRGCRECLEIVSRSLSTLNGILLMKLFDNELVITYDPSTISFSDIAQLVLSLGVGVLLRKVILSIGNKDLDGESLSRDIVGSIDGIVELIYDPHTSLISILAHPEVDLETVLKWLRARGVDVRGVVVDEVSQVLMARS